MNRVLFYFGFGFGVLLFILGFFTLKPTKFGYESATMTYGLVVMSIVYLNDRIDNLRDCVVKRRKV